MNKSPMRWSIFGLIAVLLFALIGLAQMGGGMMGRGMMGGGMMGGGYNQGNTGQSGQTAEQGAALFRINCMSCHARGGNLIYPKSALARCASA